MEATHKTSSQRKAKKYGIRKQWKMLCEYATERNGDITNMKTSDNLYEGGPTIGDFLLQHYLSKCIAPALRRAATSTAEAPKDPEPTASEPAEKRPAEPSDAPAAPPKKRAKKKEAVQVTIAA